MGGIAGAPRLLASQVETSLRRGSSASACSQGLLLRCSAPSACLPEAARLPGGAASCMRACKCDALQCDGQASKRPCPAPAATGAAPEQSAGCNVHCYVVECAKGGLLVEAAGKPAVNRVQAKAGGKQPDRRAGIAAATAGSGSRDEGQQEAQVAHQVGR